MHTEHIISLIIGFLMILFGIALALVEVDRDKLSTKSRSNPGLALFRFPAYRYFAAVVLICVGILVVVTGG